jgi:NDP-sugar pyrophosphorylase family protein
MKGMILAAGFGNRLKPRTDTLPKPLFPIGGTNMIKNAVGYLLANGIRDIAVNLHHLPLLIKKEISSGTPANLNLRLIEEKEIMGTAGGIKGAEDFIGNSVFAVVNSDILIDINIAEAAAVHEANGAVVTLVVRKNPHPERYGILAVEEGGRLARFLKTTIPEYREENLVSEIKMFTGLAVYSPEIFRHIPAGRPVDLAAEILPALVKNGFPVYTCDHTGYWADIGTPEGHAAAQNDVEAGRFRTYATIQQ